MSKNVAQILDNIYQLSQQERAELAYAFICSLEPQEEGVSEAWDAELAQRVAEIRGGRTVGKPAAQLFRELRENRQ